MGSALPAALLVSACQAAAPTGGLSEIKREHWQTVYQNCLTEVAHGSPALTGYLDMSQVAHSCRRLADQVVERS